MATEQIGMRIFVDEGFKAKLYRVTNTANNRIFVLAQNKSTAIHTAEAYGHIKEPKNASIYAVDIAKPQPHEEKFYASVKAAIKAGRQGIVKNVDGHAAVGNGPQATVFSPLNIVK